MLRRLSTAVSALSLLLCIAAVILWVPSLHREVATSRMIRGDRYTLICAGGRIGLYGPPPAAGSPKVKEAAEVTVAALRNDQIKWSTVFNIANPPPNLILGVNSPEPLPATPAEYAEAAFSLRELSRPLLAALEDPQRVVAAHVLLHRATTQPSWWETFDCEPIPNRLLGRSIRDVHKLLEGTLWARTDVDGLKITFSRWGQPDRDLRDGWTTHGDWVDRVDGDPDVSQIPKICDQWHRRLDVRIAFAPLWTIVAITAALPFATASRRLGRWLVRRREIRRGHCPHCGYDLRASTERCPECGTVVPPTKA